VAEDGLLLEIVEGSSAGRQLALDRRIVIGRAADADLVLDDAEVSRQHASVTPASDRSAVVEDLGSANGTFINRNELHGPARLDPGDELLLGVTLIEVRSREQVAAQPSAVRSIPPALAAAPRTPRYVDRERAHADAAPESAGVGATPALEKYLDVRVRRRAQLAPLALFLLVVLALIVYFALR
jgi:pSer/pThr/pTyr-binding forkhead associated (FHA) protein